MAARTIEGSGPFEVRFWEPGDAATAARLLHAGTTVDGRDDRGVAWFDWKMAASPLGPSVVAYAVDRETGDVAGEVAFGPWTLWRRGAPLRAALSYETFVVPTYQRRGLFQLLATAGIAELRRRGVEIIVNFPNRNSLPGFTRLGFKTVETYRTWLRPSRPSSVVALAGLVRAGGRATSVEPAAAPTVGDDWIEAAAGLAALARLFPVEWASARDAATLRWRYATRATWRYVTASNRYVALLARVERRGAITECRLVEAFSTWSPPRGAVADAIAELTAAAGAELITAQLSRHHPLTRALPRLGFLPVPDHVTMCADGPEAWLTSSSWVMSGGDFHTT